MKMYFSPLVRPFCPFYLPFLGALLNFLPPPAPPPETPLRERRFQRKQSNSPPLLNLGAPVLSKALGKGHPWQRGCWRIPHHATRCRRRTRGERCSQRWRIPYHATRCRRRARGERCSQPEAGMFSRVEASRQDEGQRLRAGVWVLTAPGSNYSPAQRAGASGTPAAPS